MKTSRSTRSRICATKGEKFIVINTNTPSSSNDMLTVNTVIREADLFLWNPAKLSFSV